MVLNILGGKFEMDNSLIRYSLIRETGKNGNLFRPASVNGPKIRAYFQQRRSQVRNMNPADVINNFMINIRIVSSNPDGQLFLHA